MTIPKFATPEEADAWLDKQARLDRSSREHARVTEEIISISGPVWDCDNGHRVLYSTVRTSTGKFAVAVFKKAPAGAAWGECIYNREFAKRKDAKARAYALWLERRKKK